MACCSESSSLSLTWPAIGWNFNFLMSSDNIEQHNPSQLYSQSVSTTICRIHICQRTNSTVGKFTKITATKKAEKRNKLIFQSVTKNEKRYVYTVNIYLIYHLLFFAPLFVFILYILFFFASHYRSNFNNKNLLFFLFLRRMPCLKIILLASKSRSSNENIKCLFCTRTLYDSCSSCLSIGFIV